MINATGNSEVYLVSENPIIEKQNKYKKYNVTLVTRIFEGEYTIKEYNNIKELCTKHSINFIGREYNSRIYDEDCDFITRLPAFHIHDRTKNRYVATFYEGQNPLEIIDNNNIEKISFLKRILNLFHKK